MIGQSMQQEAEPAADQGMLDAEMREALDAAIARLSPRRKRIFTMSHMQGLSNEEIARELALSPHTVKNTLADSVRSLRGILQKKHSVG
jgi:RNA polymerase sigma-70 factor (ECF subfamily)